MIRSTYNYGISDVSTLLIRQAYGDYLASERKGRPGGRILVSPTGLGSYDAASTRRQGCYLRLVSIVEAYVDSLNRFMLDLDAPINSRWIDVLLEEVERASVKNWGERIRTLKKFHRISLKSCSSWKQFEPMTHVRNTIAHGLGRLTVIQRTNDDLLATLAKVDIFLMDGKLIITEQSLSLAVDISVAMIAEIDAAAAP